MHKNRRIAAIDYGTVRIGIALSDERKIIAQPLLCLPAQKNHEKTALAIKETLAKHDIEKLLMGLPLYLDGNDSPMSLEVRKFAKILMCTLNIEVVLCDERLTSALVERALIEGNINRKKRKTLVDALAATVILQNYLDIHYANESFGGAGTTFRGN